MTAQTVPVPATPPLSLLVAQSDPALSAAMVEILTDAGHAVVAVAGTPESAAGQAALHVIDLAIIDADLADEGDGVALADGLHDRWGIPALYLADGERRLEVGLNTALARLAKPFSSEQLVAAVGLAGTLLGRGEFASRPAPQA